MESGKAAPESSGRKDESKSGDGQDEGRKRRKDECKSGDGRDKGAPGARGWPWVLGPES